MNQRIMIIAPGQEVDRMWVPGGAEAWGAWEWLAPRSTSWSFDYPGTDPMLEPRARTERATIRRWRGPGWQIILPFYVHAEIARPPNGYVMPGSVVGVRLESCDLADRERAIREGVVALEQAGPDA